MLAHHAHSELGSNRKRSDDGKSEKGSNYGDNDSHYDGSKKGGNQCVSLFPCVTSNADTICRNSLLKKYGNCEKTAIGKGATAVVRLAHKWDKTTEKLYAVKVG